MEVKKLHELFLKSFCGATLYVAKVVLRRELAEILADDVYDIREH